MPLPNSCIRHNELLSNHTSFRIGGPAEYFAEPTNVEELLSVLAEARALKLPISVVGGGTNTLAPDRGIQGVVVHLGRGFKTVKDLSEENSPTANVRCGAALLTQRLVYLAAKHGWGELEVLAGLPGWIGGAISMNAQDIGRFVQEVNWVGFDGSTRCLTRQELAFRYRYAAIEPGIITDVVLAFPKVAPEEAYARIRQTLQYRNSTQEVRLPSAGCAFKNPPGTGAGKMIDELGLKGSRIGDAMISHRHANFIVNLGRATCDDVLSLMEHVQQRVRQARGIQLEPEVRMIGETCAR